jgi:predicted nucleic acid-binding protein
MTADCFLDTNILLYAGSAAPADGLKSERSQNLILNTRFAISAQVIQEFIANALRKKELGLRESNIDAFLELTTLVPVLPITRELLIQSNLLRRKHKISPWDATVVAAALELGCHTLYTEDLNHGQNFNGLKVINPFL